MHSGRGSEAQRTNEHAASSGAAIGAVVGVVFVAIIAFFNADLYGAIAAARGDAGAQTSVGIFDVSIITSFSSLDDAIAAAAQGAGVTAFVSVVFVAIVTTFAGLDEAITA